MSDTPELPIMRGLLDDAAMIQISNDHPETDGYCSSSEHGQPWEQHTTAPCDTRRLLDHMAALKRLGFSVAETGHHPEGITDARPDGTPET